MTERPSPGMAAITAGAQLISTMLTCAAIGFGIGWLFGLAVPLGLAGLFAGLIVGFALVHARFRRI